MPHACTSDHQVYKDDVALICHGSQSSALKQIIKADDRGD